MDIHQLKVFAAVYRLRSFSRASEELGLSQPTVSEHIKGLEAELGTKLFDRMGRSIQPTEEAEVLYLRAVEIAEKMEEIKTELGGLRGELQGLLTVGASTIPGTYIIPSLAAEFRKRHRGVFFQVIIDDSRKITEMVLAGELLLGVVGAKMAQERLDYVPLVEDRLVLAARPGLIGKDAVTVRELAGIPFLLREEGSGTRKSMERYLEDRGISLDDMSTTAVLGSTASICEAMKSGLGASILSRLAVKEDVKAGRLEEVRVKGLSMKRDFFLITHTKRTLPRHYEAFFAFLKERLHRR